MRDSELRNDVRQLVSSRSAPARRRKLVTTIYLEIDQVQRLADVAVLSKEPMAEHVRRAIDSYLSRYWPEVRVVVSADDLVASARDGGA